LRNALTEAHKRDYSWRKYVIIDCYGCKDATGQGLAGHSHSYRYEVKQEEIHPVQGDYK
jgi:hypothetical protein